MAERRLAMSGFDAGSQQIESILAKALRSKGNLLALARCAEQLQLSSVEQRARELVATQSIVTDIDRGRALWDLLREAMARLRPTNTEPEITPAWRLYAIADGVYVQGKSAKVMITELNVSPRTFYRERRDVVRALATVLVQLDNPTRGVS